MSEFKIGFRYQISPTVYLEILDDLDENGEPGKWGVYNTLALGYPIYTVSSDEILAFMVLYPGGVCTTATDEVLAYFPNAKALDDRTVSYDMRNGTEILIKRSMGSHWQISYCVNGLTLPGPTATKEADLYNILQPVINRIRNLVG